MALACKRNITVVEVTSTRMLMAHGFLRRLFEVFERYRTAVDVVTTSEVSVSVTIDDNRRLQDIARGLSEFAEVTIEPEMALLCAVGENLRRRSGVCDPHARRSRRRAAADGVAGGIEAQRHGRHPRQRCPGGDVAPAQRMVCGVSRRNAGRGGAVSAMRVLIVGHGRMGRLVESLAPEAGVEIAGLVDIDNADRPEAWPAADVAIDFSTAAAVVGNARRLAARGTHLVIGTTGWQEQEAALKRELAALPVGVVSAPNFALGVNLFVALAARAAELLAERPEFGAWIHELHHSAKRDAPSGTAIGIRDAMQNAGYTLPIDVASTRVGSIPGTHTVGFDSPAETITLTHTARDRTGFARGALAAAKWVNGRQRVVHDAGRSRTLAMLNFEC